MAIYVKGMEMPNSCDDCPINNDWRCALRINTPHQHNIDAGAWKYRMGWCPLVEVPVDEERRAMTREEAIRKLKRELEAIEGDWRFKEFAEALDMAIEALRNEINCVKCQYYTERETYTGIGGVCKMDTAHREDLISREEVLQMIIVAGECEPDLGYAHLYSVIESLPSVETPTVSEKHQLSEDTPTNTPTDLISRQDVIELVKKSYYDLSDGEEDMWAMVHDVESLPSAERLTDDDFETIRIHLSAIKGELCNQHRWGEAKEYERLIERFMAFAPAEPKTGKWIQISPAKIYECSECGQNVMTGDIEAYKFCHGCGANMNWGEEE